MIRSRAFVPPVVVIAAVASIVAVAPAARATTYVDDPLTSSSFTGRGQSGGSFGASGFTTTAASDSIWYEMPEAVPSGRVEFTVTGLSLASTLMNADNDIFTMYQAPTGVTEPIPYWPWRNNDFKVFLRIFGVAETGRPGAMKLELAGCPRGEPWWHDEACPDTCTSIDGIAYASDGHDVGWDAAATYRFAIAWGAGTMTFSRDGVALGSVSYPSTFAPQPMRIRIGTPRNDIPVGITVRDVHIEGTGGAMTPTCTATAPMDAGTPVIPDAGPAACDPVIEAAGLSPSIATGTDVVFDARYRNCYGASAFRIVQLWVGDSVAVGVPNVQLGYEGGRIFLESQSCAPGEGMVLHGAHGSIDCARSTATPSGNELAMRWAMQFDASNFAGVHGVFFDAKGPSTKTPEPRLGWTRMGTFTVAVVPDAGTADAGAVDAGSSDANPSDAAPSMDAARDVTTRDAGTDSRPPEGGCGCTTPGRLRDARSVLGLIGLAMMAVVRRRRSTF
jgi:hypothetical protein